MDDVFVYDSVKFLGQIMDVTGGKADPDNVEGVTNMKELVRWWGW